MKRRWTAFAILGVLMTLGFTSAVAQTSNMLIVQIPFKFVAGDHELPAGKYTIKQIALKKVLIQSEDRRLSTAIAVNYTQAKAALTAAKIVFNRYDDRYFLAQIYKAGTDSGYEVRRTAQEEVLAKNRAERQQVTVTINQR